LIYFFVPRACYRVRSLSVAFIDHMTEIVIVVMYIGMLFRVSFLCVQMIHSLVLICITILKFKILNK
jgi:hypothetical protein